MTASAFTIFAPAARTTSVVFSSPHSGRDYPASFLARSVLDERLIRSSEDAFVDQLFGAAPDHGAPLICARAPRAYVDLNRAADELDPALIEGLMRGQHNPRVNSGLGVIPRVVANGRSIYRGKLTQREADTRIADHWVPYHAALSQLMGESVALFGEAVLIDCHSMPHEAIEAHTRPGGRMPQVVLGDRYGAAADAAVVDRIEAIFTAAGLVVARNAPFAGAYITQAYGRPSANRHVLQIEIDRALYLDEAHIRPGAGFADFRAVMGRVVADIADIGRARGALAAE